MAFQCTTHTEYSLDLPALLVLTPFVGVSANGAQRWLAIPGLPVSIQPAEPARLATVMALALILAACRGVAASDRAFRSGTEAYLHDGNVGRISLYGRTVGFVGCGGLARGLQPLLAPFRTPILGYDPWLAPDELASRGIEPCGLEELFDRSAAVCVLAVPTPENRAMISRG